MSRVIACVLRIASICLPRNPNLAISSTVFLNAGEVLIYLLNVALARHIVRTLYPRIGSHPLFTGTFWGLCTLIVLSVAMVLTAIVQSFFTLNLNTHRIDRDIQLYSLTCFAMVSFLPLPIGTLAFLPPVPAGEVEYGHGKLRKRGALLVTGAFFVCLGATYRCATTWMTPVLLDQPEPAYDSRGCFYVFYFAMDILVIALYAVTRVDQLFFIPVKSEAESLDVSPRPRESP